MTQSFFQSQWVRRIKFISIDLVVGSIVLETIEFHDFILSIIQIYFAYSYSTQIYDVEAMPIFQWIMNGIKSFATKLDKVQSEKSWRLWFPFLTKNANGF